MTPQEITCPACEQAFALTPEAYYERPVEGGSILVLECPHCRDVTPTFSATHAQRERAWKDKQWKRLQQAIHEQQHSFLPARDQELIEKVATAEATFKQAADDYVSALRKHL